LKNPSMDGKGFLLSLVLLFSSLPSFASDAGPDVTVCASGNTVSGLDVSDFDPGTNWPVVQAGGNVFTFIKATEGATFVNGDFASDWMAAKNSGLIRSAYHFFHPSIDPTRQANSFLATVGRLASDDLPAMFDWEISGNESAAIQKSRALLWLAQVESATGKTPIIYTNPSFWKTLGDTSDFARYPLFIANYEVSCPNIPAPWTTWAFWQYRLGPLDGVQADTVDLDVFNGSIDQLQGFSRRNLSNVSISKGAQTLNI
jgi:lysozyme